MDDIGRVEVLHAPSNLIHDVAVVQILENLLADGVVKVGFHKFEDEIEVLVVVSFDHVVKFDYVRVVQLVQVANLSVGPLRVDRVLKGIEYLLQGESLP